VRGEEKGQVCRVAHRTHRHQLRSQRRPVLQRRLRRRARLRRRRRRLRCRCRVRLLRLRRGRGRRRANGLERRNVAAEPVQIRAPKGVKINKNIQKCRETPPTQRMSEPRAARLRRAPPHRARTGPPALARARARTGARPPLSSPPPPPPSRAAPASAARSAPGFPARRTASRTKHPPPLPVLTGHVSSLLPY
jgi:hypothetical protein